MTKQQDTFTLDEVAIIRAAMKTHIIFSKSDETEFTAATIAEILIQGARNGRAAARENERKKGRMDGTYRDQLVRADRKEALAEKVRRLGVPAELMFMDV